jgi:hypothetical protein
MHEQSSKRRAAGGARLERAIVLLLLSGDGRRRWSRRELAAELGAEVQPLQNAIDALSDAGVVCVAGTEVCASGAALRMDELGLIGI